MSAGRALIVDTCIAEATREPPASVTDKRKHARPEQALLEIAPVSGV